MQSSCVRWFMIWLKFSQNEASWLNLAIFLRHRGISQDVVQLWNISPLPNGDKWCLGFSVMKVCNLPVLLKIICMHFRSQTWWLILRHISHHCKSQKRVIITYFSAFLHAEATYLILWSSIVEFCVCTCRRAPLFGSCLECGIMVGEAYQTRFQLGYHVVLRIKILHCDH